MNTSKIPVHQILIADVEDIHEYLPKSVQSVDKYFDKSKYLHVVWDKESILAFITENFDQEVVDAYNKLKPYAYKADLARYCIAYVLGGWYVDINITIVASPPDVSNFDMCIIRDYNSFVRTAPWQLSNGLFYSVPKHPALLNAISGVVRHTQELYYGKRTLSPTGPELFGQAVAQFGWHDDNMTRYLLGDFNDNVKLNRKQFTFNNKTFALNKEASGGNAGIKGTNNYVEMWHNRDIYNK